MGDLVERLRAIDAASRRNDGSQIPLGECPTEAADEIASLRARVAELEEVLADATEHLGLVLGSDPGPREQACRLAALKWWMAYDAGQERAALSAAGGGNGE